MCARTQQNPERQGWAERAGEVCLTKHLTGLSGGGRCEMVPLSPQFVAYTRYYWHWRPKQGFRPDRGKRGEPRVKMSTGFAGVALALHLCDEVSLFGFNSSDGHYYDKAPTHGISRWERRHPWQVERSCLRTLARVKRVTLYGGAD